MKALRRWWKLALAMAGLLIAAQIGVSLLVRTRGVHRILVARLSRAFGRPVEVRHFGAQLLPSPTLAASGITVGEDPAFGNEYFLRAESFSAGLRWTGLLRGRFEFGTLSFARPSLILVRNAEGRWNLERWLPPAKSSGTDRAVFYGPTQPTPSNHLQKIEFDEGRVNFKVEYDKQAFAFTDVSGSVEQVAPGRWELQLAATPWRSGVALQSTGRVRVRGDVAGTSSRLQPAQVQVHWDEASLADIFRLWSGQDYGVRGVFALDGTLQSGIAAPDAAPAPPAPLPGGWTFSVQARATRIHRWDFAERADNPRLNAIVKGNFFSDTRAVEPAYFSMEAPQSNVRGYFSLGGFAQPDLLLRVDSIGVQAADLLAWCRAFQSDIDEGISVQQFFTGSAILRGWPLQVESAGFSSAGGALKIPGIDGGVQLGALRGGRERSKLAIEPVRISWNSAASVSGSAELSTAAVKRKAADTRSGVSVGLTHDFVAGEGALTLDGHAAKTEQILHIARAFGRPLNRGWELTGEANAALQWNWSAGKRGRWNGKLGFSRAQLQVAGLNQPLLLDEAELDYKDGRRIAEIAKAQGFGASWSGEIAQRQSATAATDAEAKWQFQLHADKIEAADLDRWVGPRARPGWLQRVMNSLRGGANANPAAGIPASELLRRVNAEGELRIDDLTVEKLTLRDVHATGSLHDLQTEIREADAQWAGGSVRGTGKAQFAPKPGYEVSVEFDRVNLAQLPDAFAARLAGLASGKLHLAAAGVGREVLLKSLEGAAQVRVKNVELRGWDVPASMADGTAHAGVSRWTAGAGVLRFRDRGVLLDDFRLENGQELTLINGRVTFGQDADLSMETTASGKHTSNFAGAGRVLKISGPLDLPRVSVENAVARQPAD
jgi:uncharacterized protein involved in outer membrane biogenesis